MKYDYSAQLADGTKIFWYASTGNAIIKGERGKIVQTLNSQCGAVANNASRQPKLDAQLAEVEEILAEWGLEDSPTVRQVAMKMVQGQASALKEFIEIIGLKQQIRPDAPPGMVVISAREWTAWQETLRGVAPLREFYEQRVRELSV